MYIWLCPINVCNVLKGEWRMLTEGGGIISADQPPGTAGVPRPMPHPADHTCPPDRPTPISQTRGPKPQARPSHWRPAQEPRKSHPNDRDPPKDGRTHPPHDRKDHPPVQLLRNFDELLHKIPVFQKDCRDSHLVREVREVRKNYGRGRDRKHDAKKLRKGARFHDCLCGRRAAP